MLLRRNAALEAEVKRLQRLVAELRTGQEKQNVYLLNDYLLSNIGNRTSFREQMIPLIGQGRPIERVSEDISHITSIIVRRGAYGALTQVLTVIVRHTRRKHLAMIHDGQSPHGNRPTPERRDFFHALHSVFGIDETDRRQLHSFDQRLRSVIALHTT